MSAPTNVAEQIILKKEGSKEGNATFNESYNGKTIEFEVSWKRKFLYVKISIQKPYPGSDFIPCKLIEAIFLGALMRYTNYNLYGTVSKFSDHFMESEAVTKLLTQRKASIELLERSMVYECKIKNCPQRRLEILIELVKRLNDELDELDEIYP